jgi:sulfur carrier protein ThiS adenylyltransferase
MKIKVNEHITIVPKGSTVGSVAEQFCVGADVLVLNGFPVPSDTLLKAGDELFLIRRGEIPPADELEFLMAARHTPGVHARLKKACVGIAGVGGLGSVVAVALARIGIGHLVLADFDVVEPSNLNRQQYFIDQIGMYKVDALAATLQRINPYCRLETHREMVTRANAAKLFAPCSVIVEAFDVAEMKAMLVDTVLETMSDAILVAASGVAGYGSNNSIQTRKAGSRLYLVGDGLSEAAPGNGLMAPRVGIAAAQQANQVVRLLLGEEL